LIFIIDYHEFIKNPKSILADYNIIINFIPLIIPFNQENNLIFIIDYYEFIKNPKLIIMPIRLTQVIIFKEKA
jgi:hypothetical protein